LRLVREVRQNHAATGHDEKASIPFECGVEPRNHAGFRHYPLARDRIAAEVDDFVFWECVPPTVLTHNALGRTRRRIQPCQRFEISHEQRTTIDEELSPAQSTDQS